MKDTMTGKIGYTPILPDKVSIKNIKGTTHKNGDIHGRCKRSLTLIYNE